MTGRGRERRGEGGRGKGGREGGKGKEQASESRHTVAGACAGDEGEWRADL